MQTCYRHSDQPAGVVCQRCDRPICPKCMHQASVGFHCPECVKSGKQKVITGPGAFQVRPIVTQVLVAINVAIFLIGAAVSGGKDAISGGNGTFQFDFALVAKLWQRGNSLYTGSVSGSHGVGVGAGQWYRMVTSGFLHYGILHIALNMYALWILGRAVEQYGGRLRFGIVYAVALVGGSLGALVLSPDSLTAGASGAIFGLMGALMVGHRAQGVSLRNSPLIGVLLLNLVFTFGFPGISIGGHLGGLVGGAAAGWILFDLAPRKLLDPRLAYGLCALLGLACIVGGVVFASGYTPS